MPDEGRACVVAHVVWKALTVATDIDLRKAVDLHNQCVAKQKQYYNNRATRGALLAVVSPLYISSKSAMLATVTYFTGESNINGILQSDRTTDNQVPQIVL